MRKARSRHPAIPAALLLLVMVVVEAAAVAASWCEILAQDVIGSDGRVVRSTLSQDIAAQVLKGVERPAYDRIRKPALAIYAMHDVRSTYPNFESFDAENKARAGRQIVRLTQRFLSESVAR